jgi:hypothetical protein
MSTYPWIRNSTETTTNTNVVNTLTVYAPKGLYLRRQTLNSELEPYYMYSHSYQFYTVNDQFNTPGALPCYRNSKIFFDASLSQIDLYVEDNNEYQGKGSITSLTINGFNQQNKITLLAQHSGTKPTDGVLAVFNGTSRQISFTANDINPTVPTSIVIDGPTKRIDLIADSGLFLNGQQIVPGGGGGGVTDIQAGSGISINQSTGSVTITNTGGGGGGGDVSWSQLNDTYTTYGNLSSGSTSGYNPSYTFGLNDGANQYIAMSINSNEQAYLNHNFPAFSLPYLKIGHPGSGVGQPTVKYALYGAHDTTLGDLVTIATVNSDMYLYADKVPNDRPRGAGNIYMFANNILPGNGNNTTILGSSNDAWSDVNSYQYNNPSDIKLKKDINSLDTEYCLNLIQKTNPVSYSYKNDDLEKKHFGVIAQEIKEIIKDENLSLHTDGETQTICYTEFIAPLIKTVQHLLQKVEDLESQIKALKK